MARTQDTRKPAGARLASQAAHLFGCSLLIAVISGLPPPAAGGEDAAQLEARLEALRGRITEISASLEADRARRDAETDRLARIEQELGRLGRALRETRGSLEEVRSEITELEQQSTEIRIGLAARQAELAGQLRAAYRLGAQSRIRTLLAENEPRRIARLMAWHGYLARARARTVGELVSRLEELNRIGELLDRRREVLAALQADQQRSLAEQAAAREARAAALAQLETRIEDSEAELAELRDSAAELEALLEELADALADIPPDVESPRLSELRGRLTMPVAGPLRARFGDRRSGEINWTGWLIGADSGTEVRAIGHGRVAYADWLRGYGLMLIVEHGDGFMSLYGHNESLLVDVGDWIGPGEIVALVGNSGGEPEPGLYFELRRDGEPINPAGWFE